MGWQLMTKRARAGSSRTNCASSRGKRLPVPVLTSERQGPGPLTRLRRPKAYTLNKPLDEIEGRRQVVPMLGRTLI